MKVLSTKPSIEALGASRFDREARAIPALSPPNICAIYDVGQAGERHFLVMELLDGETPHSRLARGAIELSTFREQAIALADALDAAHTRGLLHRGLKPGSWISG